MTHPRRRWRCRRYQSWLVDGADSLPETPPRPQLARHLLRCSTCQTDLEGLRSLPATLRTSTVPDPGNAFWLQQQQTIARVIRNLPEPRDGWSLEWIRYTLQGSPWRYPIASAVALVVALSVYRRATHLSGAGGPSISRQLAQLDANVLVALADVAAAVTPWADDLNYGPHDEEVGTAALATGDLVGPQPLAPLQDETDLSGAELERLNDLLGGGLTSNEG